MQHGFVPAGFVIPTVTGSYQTMPSSNNNGTTPAGGPTPRNVAPGQAGGQQQQQQQQQAANKQPQQQQNVSSFVLNSAPSGGDFSSAAMTQQQQQSGSVFDIGPADLVPLAAGSNVKNPLMLFNEKFPDLNKQIVLEQLEVPNKLNDNKPLFKASVTTDSRIFTASGHSKKLAKHNLALQILEQLSQNSQIPLSFSSLTTTTSPTGGSKKRPAAEMMNASSNNSPMITDESRTDAKRRKLLEKMDRNNYLSVFQEMCTLMGEQFKPKIDYQDVSTAEAKPHEHVIECVMTVGDKMFKAKGMGKKFLKQEVVKQAYKELFSIEIEKDFKVSDQGEILQLLSTYGRKNLRQTLQTFANRRCIPFKFEFEESTENKDQVIKVEAAPSPVAGATKIRQYVARCQFGEELFEKVSYVSKKDCLDELCISVISKVFDFDLKTIQNELNKAVVEPSRINRNETGGVSVLGGVGSINGKNPVCLLFELALRNNLEVTFSDGELVVPSAAEPSGDGSSATGADVKPAAQQPLPNNGLQFFVVATLKEHKVTGYGKNKKAAKQDAAIRMLKIVFSLDLENNQFYQLPPQDKNERKRLTKKEKFLAAAGGDDPERQFAARVAYYSKTKYAQILKEFNVVPSSTFSAFLLSDSEKTDDELEVVSLASGSRTSATRLTTPGVNLHDCHGAVLARRGLLLFFYQQLSLLSGPHAGDSIFEFVPPVQQDLSVGLPVSMQQKLYRLKKRYAVHLYDSRLPPGDASADQYDVNHRNALRCYQQDGIATVPVAYLAKQMSAQSNNFQFGTSAINPDSKSMSLSDKMLKWNVLGLQGSLLSLYLEPIYLESFVIGQDFSKSTLKKAIFSRFDASWWAPMKAAAKPTDVINKYEPSCPKMYSFEYDPMKVHLKQQQQWKNKYAGGGAAGGAEGDSAAVPAAAVADKDDFFVDNLKAPTDYALTWQVSTPVVEFIFQETGLDIQRKPSRLSKMNVFDQYVKLRQLVPLYKAPNVMYYNEAKQCSTAYCTAKARFKNSLKTNSLGSWLEKSLNADTFTLPWLSD